MSLDKLYPLTYFHSNEIMLIGSLEPQLQPIDRPIEFVFYYSIFQPSTTSDVIYRSAALASASIAESHHKLLVYPCLHFAVEILLLAFKVIAVPIPRLASSSLKGTFET